MDTQPSAENAVATSESNDFSIGRIVSVTGAKAIVILDGKIKDANLSHAERPEMGTLLAIDTPNTVVLAIVSALSVPVPAQREGEAEIWIAELGLCGEIWKDDQGNASSFNRGVTSYPSLGDRARLANKPELNMAFCGDTRASVRVGSLRQDSTIPALVGVDDLLGKHFAILGTTGTGKSCTTALILRAILKDNPAAHIVLLDPHNEYATAFQEYAEVISPRNMQLPFWMLNNEEIIEVLVGDAKRKAEIEVLQDLIPLAKARYNNGRNGENQKLRRGGTDASRFTVDTPVPYRISDLTSLIDERMGKLENKKDLSPYRFLRSRITSITQDPRYAFMFGALTVYDGMAQVLGRIFRVPVNEKPITILELTGIPSEIINVVVSVLCRLTFDFALWGEGRVPVTLVCEEAHRYVPADASTGFEPCRRAIAKIAKEGRKYGASLCIVTQRPSEIDPTILSQCNTVFALRMSNDNDQAIVHSAVSDTGSGLLEFLPALGQREAIAFGDGVSLPVRIKFDEMPKEALPRSSTACFSERWQQPVGDEDFLEQLVSRWRASNTDLDETAASDVANLAESVGIQDNSNGSGPGQSKPQAAKRAQPAPRKNGDGAPPAASAQRAAAPEQETVRRPAAKGLRKKANAASATPPASPVATPPPTAAPDANGANTSNALQSLRERLTQRANR